MKKHKKILYILSLLFTIIFFGYFVVSFNALSTKEYSFQKFDNKLYRTLDNKSFISFSGVTETIFYVNEEYYFYESIELEENIFTFKNLETEFYFIIINEKTLYSSKFNNYYHRYVAEDLT